MSLWKWIDDHPPSGGFVYSTFDARFLSSRPHELGSSQLDHIQQSAPVNALYCTPSCWFYYQLLEAKPRSCRFSQTPSCQLRQILKPTGVYRSFSLGKTWIFNDFHMICSHSTWDLAPGLCKSEQHEVRTPSSSRAILVARQSQTKAVWPENSHAKEDLPSWCSLIFSVFLSENMTLRQSDVAVAKTSSAAPVTYKLHPGLWSWNLKQLTMPMFQGLLLLTTISSLLMMVNPHN